MVERPPLVQYLLGNALFGLFVRFLVRQAKVSGRSRPLPAFGKRLVTGLPKAAVGFGVLGILTAATVGGHEGDVLPWRVVIAGSKLVAETNLLLRQGQKLRSP